MWMPDIMHPSESGDNYAFDALGLCSDVQYNELFDLVVDSSGFHDRDSGLDELKTTRLDSANSCGSSAGPGDQHARSREEAWPAGLPLAAHLPPPPLSLAPPTHPILAARGAPTKTLHMRIPVRYKGQGLAGQSEAVLDLPDLPVSRIPASRHRASTRAPSLSSSTSPPATAEAAPITAGADKSTVTTPGAPQTNIGNPSIPADKIHRTLRHRKSARDLHSARRAQLSELVKSSMSAKMNTCNHHQQPQHLTSSTPAFNEMLGYSPLQTQLQSMEQPSDASQYVPSDPSPRPSSAHSEYMRSPFSLSAENLHTQYEQATLARPHSMSSLQSTSSMSDSVGLQFALRRSSDPTDSTMFFGNQGTHPFALEDYTPWVATNVMDQESFGPSIDLSLPTESPAVENNGPQEWWNNDGKVDVEDEWAAQQMNGIASGQISSRETIAVVRHYNSVNARRSPYNPLLFLHQPPSPSLDGDDSGVFTHHIKRSGSVCSSMPSPPESPEFNFPSQMPTPEIGFPQTPSLIQGSFGSIYSSSTTRRSSLPHTPSPISHLSAAQAAGAALAATSSKSTPKSISKASSRPGSRRKASSGSMRSQAKAPVASSLSSQSNDSEMSFVNFTPHDATRILSGVAPSGSSKTKARREREAQEKRRKLSEAAAAAVLAAGGDASVLANVDL